MASTFTITATAQPAMTPPSVKLVVTQSGTPVLSSVTVNRTDSAGNVFPVRTSDGDVLTISGGTGTVFDAEAPYGQTVTYTVAANNNPTATATLAITRPWLVHLGSPKRSVTFTTGRGSSNLAESWDIPQATYPILGGGYPIVISGGARLAPSLTLPILVQTAADLAALRTLLSDGCPLLLNTPPGYGIDSAYIAVGKVASSRLTSILVNPDRLVELPYQVIGRPFGPAQAPVVWSDVAAQYSSWSAIPAGTTWAQLATP